MPIREFVCPNNHNTERLLKMSDERKDIECPDCGLTAQRIVSMIAWAPTLWGDCTGQFGVNGVWDPILKCQINNERHRDQILKERGLVRNCDIKETVEADIRKSREKKAAEKALDNEIDSLIASGVDAAEAVNTVISAEKVLAGAFDTKED